MSCALGATGDGTNRRRRPLRYSASPLRDSSAPSVRLSSPRLMSPGRLARQATVRVRVAGLSATPPRLSATSEPATPTASISSSPSASNGRLLCSDLDFICSFRDIAMVL